MKEEESDHKLQIWQMFANYIRNNEYDHDLRNTRNPIHRILSEELKVPENKIRTTILEMQPSVKMLKSRYGSYWAGTF